MKQIKLAALIFFLLIFRVAFSQQINKTNWTTKTAKKWVKGKEWANGLKLNVHSSVDYVAFAVQYHANKELWDKIFSFLKEKNLDDLAPGKYPIDGDNAYATVTEGPSKEFDKSNWESHRNYIDLQYVIRGKEKIGVAQLAKAIVTKPYDELKDGANYTVKGKYYTASPGTFFLFFPNDVHRPNIKVDGYEVVKKIVVKIKFEKAD